MRQFIFILALIGLFTNVGWSASYEGVIADIYDGGQSIKITQVDGLTKEKKTLLVSLDAQTTVLGADSVSALKTGDVVSINAVETGTNQLSASSLSVTTNT